MSTIRRPSTISASCFFSPLFLHLLFLVASAIVATPGYAQSWTLTSPLYTSSPYPISFNSGGLTRTTSNVSLFALPPGSSTWQIVGGGGGAPGTSPVTASGTVGFSVVGTCTIKAVDGQTASAPTLSQITRSVVAETVPPIGAFESMPPSVVAKQTLTGNGWAADDATGAPVRLIEVKVDGAVVPASVVSLGRQDIVNAYGRSDYLYSGWSFSYGIGSLSLGSHTVTVTAYDNGNNAKTIGTKTFMVTAIPTTFAINGPFTYTGSQITPAISPTPSGATFTKGGTYYATAAGTYTATATANSLYTGTNINLSWTIQKSGQAAVTITSPVSFTYLGSYTAAAAGGSGTGAIVWSLGTGSTAPGAAINASTGAVTTTGAGTVVIKAYRAGDANYNASATTANFTITVNKASQRAVSITSAATYAYLTPYIATATGGAGTGAIVWSLGTGSTAPGAAINASTGAVTTTGAGAVVIKAYRAGDANYNASATTADFTITVSQNEAPTGAVEVLSTNMTGTVVTGSGWAFDPDDGAPVDHVAVLIDNVVRCTATLGLSRPDLAKEHGSARYNNAGWQFAYDYSALPTGSHSLSVVVYDSAGASATLIAYQWITRPGVSVDTDGDGIDDETERSAYHTDPNNASDASSIAPNGYSYAENYALGLAPEASRMPGRTIPVELTVIGKMTGTSASVTIVADGVTSTLGFPAYAGVAGTWQHSAKSLEGGTDKISLNLELGVPCSLQVVSTTGLSDYVVQASAHPEVAKTVGTLVEFGDGHYAGGIAKARLDPTSGRTTLTVYRDVHTPFAVLDDSEFPVRQILSFGLGGDRSGRSAGEIIFSKRGIPFGGDGSLYFLKGAALEQVWEDPSHPSHYQAKAPAGYVDVLRTPGSTTIRYYAGGTYPTQGGFKNFSAATPLATYVVERGKITRTIGGMTEVMEYERGGFEFVGATRTSSSNGVTVDVTPTDHHTSLRIWAWHKPAAPASGLTVTRTQTLTVEVRYSPGSIITSLGTIFVKTTHYDGADETAAIGAYEERSFPGEDSDFVSSGFVWHGIGAEQDQYPSGRSTAGEYRTSSGLNLPHCAVQTANGAGGGTLTEYFVWVEGPSGGTNLDAEPAIALGQPKLVREGFGDNGLNLSTDLVTTYHYQADLVDGRPAPSSSVTLQGSLQVAGSSYSYDTSGMLNNDPSLPMVRTTATKSFKSGTGASLSRVTTIFSTMLADIDRRGKPVSVIEADGTKTSYAYQRGTLASNGTWTAGSSGPDILVAELHGKSGSTIGSYPNSSSPVDPLDMDPNRSTVTERIFGAEGRLKREAAYVYTGSAFTRLSGYTCSYDALGNLTTKTDLSGRVLYEASYTGFRKTAETDEGGVAVTYEYDDYGQVHTATRSGGAYGTNVIGATTTTYAYDALGRVKSETLTPDGGGEDVQTTYTYDTVGRLKTRVRFATAASSVRQTTSIAYNSATKTTTTLPGGGTRIEQVYADGRRKSVSGTAVADVSYTYAYDAGTGYLKTVETGSTGYTTTSYADWLGRPDRVEVPTYGGGVRTVSSTYNSAGQLTKQDTKAGAIKLTPTHLFAYDSYGRLWREAFDSNDSGTIDLASDFGVQETGTSFQLGANGTDTFNWYRYDYAKGWPYDGTSAATGRFSARSYTQLTGLSATTSAHTVGIDADGNVANSTTTIDRSARLVTTSSTVTGSTAAINQISLAGHPIQATDAQGLTVVQTYDELSRLEAADDPRLGSTTYSYVAHTTAVEMTTSPDNKVTRVVYDSAGRVKSRTFPYGTTDARTDYFKYDAAGRLLNQWGDTVNPIAYDYNDLGQNTALHTYRSGTWTGSSLPSDFSGAGDVTTWTYQGATGLLTSKTDAAANAYSYTYDDANRMSTRTDGRGWVTNYVYYDYGHSTLGSGEFNGLLKQIDYTGTAATTTTDVGYTYDRAGRTATVTDAAGTRTFGYYDTATTGTSSAALQGASARLASETMPSAYGSHVLGFSYQYAVAGRANGATTGLQLDTGSLYAVTYGYDSVLRPNQVSYNSLTPFTYTYVPDSNLIDTVSQSTTGYKRDYDYLPDSNRLDKLKHFWAAAQTTETRLGYEGRGLRQTEKLQGGAYLDALGLSGVSGLDTDYSYTDHAEVTSSGKYVIDAAWNVGGLRSGSARDYQYDPIGNRTSDQNGSYTPNSVNAYDAIPGASSLTYDANGNLTADGTRTYAYDAENRLIKVTQGSSNWSYTYDYLGRRIRRTGTGIAEVRYLYDGWNLVAELNSSGGIVRRFVWGLDASGSLQGAGGVGGLLVIDAGATGANPPTTVPYYPLYDPSFNVIGLYDGAGAMAAAYEYDPFGNLQTISSGGYAAANPFRFSTKYTDTETGFVYYGRRFYLPAQGRFLGRDPIEEAGGLNLYAFCGNDGVNRYDYLGLDNWLTDMFSGIGSAIGGVVDSVVNFFRGDNSSGINGDAGAYFNSTGHEFDLSPYLRSEEGNWNSAALTSIDSFSNSLAFFDQGSTAAGPNSRLTELKHVEFTSTLWTKLTGHSKELISQARGQMLALANSRTKQGALTEVAMAIRAIENNTSGAILTIKVTGSDDIYDYRTVNPEPTMDSTITYNPLYSGAIPGTGVAERGITILAHELSHARDFAMLRADYAMEPNPVQRNLNTEFEAVRVENQIRSSLGMGLRNAYEFPFYFGGVTPVPNFDKYTR